MRQEVIIIVRYYQLIKGNQIFFFLMVGERFSKLINHGEFFSDNSYQLADLKFFSNVWHHIPVFILNPTQMHRADFLEENYDVFPILHGLYAACATSTILPFFSILSHGRRRISRTLIQRLLVSTIKCDHVKLLRLPWHFQVRSNKAKYLNVEPFSKIFYIDYTLCFVETIDGS